MTHSLRICVIEDDPLVRHTVENYLGDFGFETSSAEDGASGLALIARHRPDVVVTDLEMPGLSGAQLIAALRARFPGLPIVAMSGAADAETNEADEGMGVDSYLTKPFKARELRAALAEVMAGRSRTAPKVVD